jgi:hypothetical protein
MSATTQTLLGATPGVDIVAAVAAYEEVERPALAAYEEVERTARAAYEEVERTAWAAYEEVERTAWAAYEEVERTAQAELLDAVKGDPLAAWIVEYAMPDYHDQALMVLKALPATLDALDELADANSWCGTWTDHVSAARVAGVIPAVKP